MIYTSSVSTMRATEAGIFIPTTVFLHNTPLSIHGHAAHKPPPPKKKQRASIICMKPNNVPYSTFLSPPPSFLLCFRGSHSFSCLPPSQSQSAGRRRRPVTSTWAWWTGGWGEPSNSHFRSMCFLDSPYFTPKRRHSDLFCQRHASGRLRDLLCLLCFSAEDTMWGPGSV